MVEEDSNNKGDSNKGSKANSGTQEHKGKIIKYLMAITVIIAIAGLSFLGGPVGWIAGGVVILLYILKYFFDIHIKSILSFLMIFILLMGLAMFIFPSWYASGIFGVGTETISASLSNLPIIKEISNVFQTITNPSKTISSVSWDSEVEQNKENQALGVKIIGFKSQSNSFEPGTPITLTGSIQAASLAETSTIKVKCDLKDYTGKTESLISESNSDEATIYKGTTNSLGVLCNFNDGLTFKESQASQDIMAKKTTLSVLFDFTTKAYLRIYSLAKAQKNIYLSQNKNLFENINEPYLRSDNTITSTTTSGPMKLGIGFTQSQPLSEGSNYFFGVSLENDATWLGNLETLKQITLELPSDLELDTSGKCDFIKSGESIVDQPISSDTASKVYELNSDAIRKINVDCSNAKIYEDCISRYKEKNSFICNLKVLKAEDTTNLVGSIQVQADYTYSTKRSTTVNIIKPYEAKDTALVA